MKKCEDVSTIVYGIAASRAPSTLADGRRGKQDPEHHPPSRVADPADEDHKVDEVDDAAACDSHDGDT